MFSPYLTLTKVFTMRYQEFKPCAKLEDLFENYWLVTNGSDQELSNPIIPEHTVSLVLIKRQYFQGIRILGPHSLSEERPVEAGAVYLGARFHPWICGKEIFPDKGQLLNETAPLPEPLLPYFLHARPADFLPEQTNSNELEKDLLALVRNTAFVSHDMVRFICIQLSAGHKVSDIVEELPLSVRAVQKTFRKVTGLTMKQFADIQRLRATWKSLIFKDETLLNTVLNHGYYDQSHFINNFRKLVRHSHKDMMDFHRTLRIEE